MCKTSVLYYYSLINDLGDITIEDENQIENCVKYTNLVICFLMCR